ncbi:MAG: isochorismate synthase [Deltaproteobacteria bacterium]|nr:MAG: isochorismate synthase [Deltaproteobacteria bacterium]
MDVCAPSPVTSLGVELRELRRFLPAARDLGPLLYRRDPQTGEELLAAGEAQDLTAPSLRGTLDRLRGAAAPMGISWTAFDPSPPTFDDADLPSWEAFPRRRSFLPGILLRRRAGRSTAWTASPRWERALHTLMRRVDSPSAGTGHPLQRRALPQDEEAFRRAAAAFIAGHPFDKVVLSRRCLLQSAHDLTDPARLIRLLDVLDAAHPTSTLFALSSSPNGPVFIGATPELLALGEGRAVHTIALAGTTRACPAGPEQAEATLLKSRKDLKEHRIVVDRIRAELEGMTTRLRVQASPRLRRLPHLAHLETPIYGRLRPGYTLADAVDALHPTPAVCGLPRARARAFIARAEPFDRGLYAGTFGWLNPQGEGRFDVALRCALIQGQQALLFAGAGITDESEVDLEWSETERKLTAMRRAFEVAS